MHDIKAIRENPDAFDAAMKRRGMEAQSPAILDLDERRRNLQTELQTLQMERNEASKQIGVLHNAKPDPVNLDGVNSAKSLYNKNKSQTSEFEQEKAKQIEAVKARVKVLKDEMTSLEEEEGTLAESLNQHLAGLPNILAEDVPDGVDEDENTEVRKWGAPKTDKVPEHFEIGEALGMMDFETAAKMSGSRFVLMSGALARLERALGQFMLDTHTGEHGYTEVMPPLMIRDKAMFGTGQLPKFAEDQFRTTRGDWLLPTAEVPLTNIVMDSIVEEEYLPRRYTAFTPCFRQEAGAAGKDTRGMIRQHQFYKVEMVSIVTPEESAAEHERMTECAEAILKALDLPYRVMTLCSGDTGFGAQKTYDLEVWLPGQQRYREISSCSNCGDFQARRMNARYRVKGEKQTRFLHTLNGSGVATGRALIAVMENYYDPADGGVVVPDVLKPYMGGMEKVAAR